MHELSICASIVESLEEQAESQDFSRVKTVRLEIGELAGIELEALRFGFEVVTAGSIAEGAVLEIESRKGRGWCGHCEEEVPMREYFTCCSLCGQPGLTCREGNEMKIESVEVE